MFDASENAHWRVGIDIVIKFHGVQILHCDPPENDPAARKIKFTQKSSDNFQAIRKKLSHL
jgi:hypothetical protein